MMLGGFRRVVIRVFCMPVRNVGVMTGFPVTSGSW
jgi:hypothetical protein